MKRKMILYVLICLLTLIGSGLLIFYTAFYEKPKPEDEELTPISRETDDLNDFIDSRGEVGVYDPVFLIDNQEEFISECTIPRFGRLIVSDCIGQYLSFNLVIPAGTSYTGSYVKGSFTDDGALPSFKVLVHLNDTDDLLVKCYYNLSTNTYGFISDLDDTKND